MSVRRWASVALAAPLVLGVALPAQSLDGGRPDTYTLAGDPGGSKFEGIGVDATGSTFYVSEVTGGEIHRGDVRTGSTQEWKPEGADGRFTARGITTDAQGRVYIAGGPNGIGTGRPDLWVYDANGGLLAALRVGEPGAFLNDVAIGPDGAAYLTNSNAPQVFRVSDEGGAWRVSTWLDARETISQQPGFNLGGIVAVPGQDALIVAQGNVGRLWRVDLASREVSELDAGGADLVDADGLVLQGHRLLVVRNFSRTLTTLRLDGPAWSARLVDETATSPDRVFTTAKIARGRLLLVDSKFDEPVAAPPYEVVAMRVPR